jgi:murein L,D-transpeptidase YcbB/YkuD
MSRGIPPGVDVVARASASVPVAGTRHRDRATTVDVSTHALAAAADHGLDPADYDAAVLGEQWHLVRVTSAPAADRALFDVGLSVASARLLPAVHSGRVDPATMHWGYRVDRKAIDLGGLLREARDGKGLAATLDALQPPFAHYSRARRTLAS